MGLLSKPCTMGFWETTIFWNAYPYSNQVVCKNCSWDTKMSTPVNFVRCQMDQGSTHFSNIMYRGNNFKILRFGLNRCQIVPFDAISHKKNTLSYLQGHLVTVSVAQRSSFECSHSTAYKLQPGFQNYEATLIDANIWDMTNYSFYRKEQFYTNFVKIVAFWNLYSCIQLGFEKCVDP